ncbi:hypothetical protein IMSHALPRED_002042 [Imshaugia aleurites]|uniref:Uncharacterized protein n=1 Tax=Imshaugia aleurites TaxID=172621 RepID=A0A8H3J4D4_9LECA|nr:hypothetical protein IMSHALPRED_002042 [Imshaugia aleurites]
MKSTGFSTLVLFAFAQVTYGQWKCDYRVYGRPQLNDCAGALLSMPDASSKSSTPKLVAFRKFVEPQYLEPPFSQCLNELDAPMEQLPKFWRYNPSGDGAMAFYMYAVGAPFEAILNKYMITSQAIHPPGVGIQLNGTMTWFRVNGTLGQ